MLMDVYYAGCDIVGFTASIINIVKSWDGSIYAETNCVEVAGPNKNVVKHRYHVSVNGNFMNGCSGEYLIRS